MHKYMYTRFSRARRETVPHLPGRRRRRRWIKLERLVDYGG